MRSRCDYVLPGLVHIVMAAPQLTPYRARAAARAEGRVLEIGIGSGLNLPFYTDRVDALFGLEPSAALLQRTRTQTSRQTRSVQLIRGTAEQIPIEQGAVDTVLVAWTLCSVSGLQDSLAEIRRILKPSGHLVFVEHGLAPERRIRFWQHRVMPLWKLLSGGCHLDRAIAEEISAAGFRIARLETAYMPGPRIASFIYEGVACPS